eukprot:8385860-Alexandrium_andersonii.AAC.1
MAATPWPSAGLLRPRGSSLPAAPPAAAGTSWGPAAFAPSALRCSSRPARKPASLHWACCARHSAGCGGAASAPAAWLAASL